MSSGPNIALDQWRALVAVVDAGGYAQAAEALHKSQSAVTYAVQKIEALLGVKAFEIEGRKAVLTPTGRMLHRRAQARLEDHRALHWRTSRTPRKASAGSWVSVPSGSISNGSTAAPSPARRRESQGAGAGASGRPAARACRRLKAAALGTCTACPAACIASNWR